MTSPGSGTSGEARDGHKHGHDDDASYEPLPPVERLRAGISVVPVPLPNNSLRHVFVYVFEGDDGIYLVDAGWNTEEAWAALTGGLAQLGMGMADVRGVMVTHLHPDHYGLAGRVREASGGWVSLHPADARLLHDRYVEPADLLDRVSGMLRRAGAPTEEIARLTQVAMPVRPFVDAVTPDVLLEDGERPAVPGWDLSAIWTPGHTPGHLCFWEPRHEVLLTGDHVLPRITPNISFHPQAGDDPLGDFLASLDKLEPYEPGEVFPAHEYRWDDLHGRLEELRRHHASRFREVFDALRDGDTTAWAVASRMSWSRPWDTIDGWMRRAALGEALAHLRALQHRGILEPDDDEPTHWGFTDRAGELIG
jgi:glyoxylase-like metal-dependent hydrolase (beta-lactamase superfamily II)